MTPERTPSAPRLGKEPPRKLGVDAHGDVVGKDGKIELLMQDAEVLLHLARPPRA